MVKHSAKPGAASSSGTTSAADTSKAGQCLACDKGQNRRCARLPTCPYKRPYVTKARGLKSAAASAALAASQILANTDKVPAGKAKAKQTLAKARHHEHYAPVRAYSRAMRCVSFRVLPIPSVSPYLWMRRV
jgi:hypothetical protein